MGYDIYNQQGDYFRASIFIWPQLLGIATKNGWEPAGTIMDDNPEWNGSYAMNSRQTIRAEDAANLAAALRRSLETDEGIAEAVESLEVPESQLSGPEMEAIERAFAGIFKFTFSIADMRAKIAQAVEFFQRGAAQIH